MNIALVIGGASGGFREAIEAMSLFTPAKIYAVNDIGACIETVDVWCTLHPEFMDGWEKLRSEQGFGPVDDIVAPPPKEVGMHGAKGRIKRRLSYRWPGMNGSASSGIYGAKVAMEDGFTKVVLAGIPMSADAGHFMPEGRNGHGNIRGKVWEQHSAFVSGFNYSIPYLRGKVKSMSGYTQKILGYPTNDWLVG